MMSRTLTTLTFVVSFWASTATAQDAINWQTDLASAQRLAAQTNRLVLVHFWGTWCPPCMEMEKNVFNKPGLGTAVNPYYVPVKIQVEDGMNQDLAKQFQVDGFPCDIVMTAQGQIVSRSKGFKPAGEYVTMLNTAAQQALAAARPAAAAQRAAAPASPYAVPAVAAASPYAMQQAAGIGAPNVAAPVAGVPVAAAVGSRYSTTYTPPVASQAAPASQTTATNTASAGANDRYASYYAGRGATPVATTPVAPVATAPVMPSTPAAAPAAVAATPAAPSTAGSRYSPSTTGDRYAGSSVGDRYAASPTTAAPASVPKLPAPAVSPLSAPLSTPSVAATAPASAATVTPPLGVPAARYAIATPNTVVAAAPLKPTTVAAAPALQNSAPLAAAPPKAQPLTNNPAPTATATAAKSAAQAALLAKIPAGTPPLALDGCCPVTLSEKMVWKIGEPKFGAVHKGRTYLFASAVEQQKFLEQPDKFSPIISGNDPVAIVEEGRIVPGSRDHGVFCGGQMVLFSSAENCNKYRADQKRYDAGLRQAMQSGATLRR